MKQLRNISARIGKDTFTSEMSNNEQLYKQNYQLLYKYEHRYI